ELDKTPGTNAFAGDLFVGIHTSDNPLVQLLASDQFPSSSNVYVNETGTFDLNGFDQAISSLTLQGGTVNDPSGSTLTIASGVTTSVPTPVLGSAIQGSGTLDLDGNAAFPFTVATDARLLNDLELSVSPVITDGGIVKNGLGDLGLSGANTYDGPTDVTAGIIWVGSNQALGSTTGATTVESGASVYFAVDGLNVAENFVINGTGVASTGALLVCTGSTTLTGSVTLNTSSQIGASAGATLSVDGAIGDGGL